MQKITYEEWLPQFLGEKFYKKYIGKYDNKSSYNCEINPNLSMEFSVAAYRVGHSMVNDKLFRIKENCKKAPGGHINLKDAFFQDATKLVYKPEEMKYLLLGLSEQKSENADGFVVKSLRNMLFGDGPRGIDLTALNTQRNRDNGNSRFGIVAYYLCKYVLKKDANQCNSYKFMDFEDFHGDLYVQHELKQLYDNNPEKVELFAAGMRFKNTFSQNCESIFLEF